MAGTMMTGQTHRPAQGARELEQCQRPLIFVAMIAAGQERGRSLAVPDHGERDHHRAPGGIVTAVRQAQEAMLDAVAVEIDGRGDRRGRCTVNPSRTVPRNVGEAFDAGLGDQDGLGDLQPHRVQPEAGHEVEGHAGLQPVRSPGRRLIVRSPQSGG